MASSLKRSRSGLKRSFTHKNLVLIGTTRAAVLQNNDFQSGRRSRLLTQRSRSMSYPLNPDPGDAVTRDTHIISPAMNPATAALETFLNKEPLCIDDGYDSCCSDGADYEEAYGDVPYHQIKKMKLPIQESFRSQEELSSNWDSSENEMPQYIPSSPSSPPRSVMMMPSAKLVSDCECNSAPLAPLAFIPSHPSKELRRFKVRLRHPNSFSKNVLPLRRNDSSASIRELASELSRILCQDCPNERNI